MNVKASFLIEAFQGAHTITPVIDGVTMVELVGRFEGEQHFDPVGGYRGIVPQWFKYGDLDRYFFADFAGDNFFVSVGGIYFLGCDCGEVGCWPLKGRIRVDGASVIWEKFEQPHRSERDYSSFGPFVFDLEQYRRAVSTLCKEYAALVPSTE